MALQRQGVIQPGEFEIIPIFSGNKSLGVTLVPAVGATGLVELSASDDFTGATKQAERSEVAASVVFAASDQSINVQPQLLADFDLLYEGQTFEVADAGLNVGFYRILEFLSDTKMRVLKIGGAVVDDGGAVNVTILSGPTQGQAATYAPWSAGPVTDLTFETVPGAATAIRISAQGQSVQYAIIGAEHDDSAFSGSGPGPGPGPGPRLNRTSYFNGDAILQNYIVGPEYGDGRLGTLSFWAKFNLAVAPGQGMIMAGGEITPGIDLPGWRLYYDTTAAPFRLLFGVKGIDGVGAVQADRITFQADVIPNDDQWHHYMLSWEHIFPVDSEAHMDMYVDGVYVPDGTSPGNVYEQANVDVDLRYDTPSNTFAGNWYDSVTGDVDPIGDFSVAEFYLNFDERADLSSEFMRNCFYAGGTRVSLGSTGALPTGSQPAYYAANGDLVANQGSASSLPVLQGDVRDSDTAPAAAPPGQLAARTGLNGGPGTIWGIPSSQGEPSDINGLFTISFWARLPVDFDGTLEIANLWNQFIDSASWRLDFTNGVIALTLNNANNDVVYVIDGLEAPLLVALGDGQYHHFAMCGDVSLNIFTVLLDGQDISDSSTVTGNPLPVAWEPVGTLHQHAVYGQWVSGKSALASPISADFTEVYFNMQEYIDLTAPANLEKFRDSLTLEPVDLGFMGQIPTGSQPSIYLPYGHPADNRGSWQNYVAVVNQIAPLCVLGPPTVVPHVFESRAVAIATELELTSPSYPTGDSNFATVSFWIDVDATMDGQDAPIIQVSDGAGTYSIRVTKLADGSMQFLGFDSAGTEVINSKTAPDFVSGTGLHHYLFSVNKVNVPQPIDFDQYFYLYVDGVRQQDGVNGVTMQMAGTDTEMAVSTNGDLIKVFGTEVGDIDFKGEISNLYFNVADVPQNWLGSDRREPSLFISEFQEMVYQGDDGTLPVGSLITNAQPIIYAPNGDPSIENNGYGGLLDAAIGGTSPGVLPLPTTPDAQTWADVNVDGFGDKNKAEGVVGIADDTAGTMSFWIKGPTVQGGTLGGTGVILQGADAGGGVQAIDVTRTTGDDSLSFVMRDSGGTELFNVTSPTGSLVPDEWNHVIAAWDFQAANPVADNFNLYINGVSSIDTASQGLVQADINYAAGAWSQGMEVDADPNSVNDFLVGSLSEIWFDPTQRLDISDISVREDFRNPDGTAAQLGVDGSIPTGSVPSFYASNGSLVANEGTGPDLTDTQGSVGPVAADSAPIKTTSTQPPAGFTGHLYDGSNVYVLDTLQGEPSSEKYTLSFWYKYADGSNADGNVWLAGSRTDDLSYRAGHASNVATNKVLNFETSVDPLPNNTFDNDFLSYSLGSFPQDGNWTVLQADTGRAIDVIASSSAFPNQQLDFVSTSGAGGSQTLVYNPAGNFVDGKIVTSFAFNAIGNLQTCVVLQAVDANNLLEMRYRADSGGIVYIIEKIAGVDNNRHTSPGQSLSNGVPYVMEFEVTGTVARGTIYAADGITVIYATGPVAITGGVSGKSGLRRVSAVTNGHSYFDTVVVTAAAEDSTTLTDDFNSYSTPIFPQGGWSVLQNSGGWTSQVNAGDPIFLTQAVQLTGPASPGAISLVYDTGGDFINGTVEVRFYYPANGIAVMPSLVMQAVDADNLLTLLYRVDTNDFIFQEIIGGAVNVRRAISLGVSPPGLTEYVLRLTVVDDRADIGMYQADGITGVVTDTNVPITGGVSGKAGFRHVSVSNTNPTFYDNFKIVKFGNGYSSGKFDNESFSPSKMVVQEGDELWHHAIIAKDTIAGEARIVIDGVSDFAQATGLDSEVQAWEPSNFANHSIGGNVLGTLPGVLTAEFEGCLAEVYFNTQEFVDPTVPANLAKFRTVTNLPVDLGTDGSLPTGTSPAVYARQGDPRRNTGRWDNYVVRAGNSAGVDVLGPSQQPGLPVLWLDIQAGASGPYVFEDVAETTPVTEPGGISIPVRSIRNHGFLMSISNATPPATFRDDAFPALPNKTYNVLFGDTNSPLINNAVPSPEMDTNNGGWIIAVVLAPQQAPDGTTIFEWGSAPNRNAVGMDNSVVGNLKLTATLNNVEYAQTQPGAGDNVPIAVWAELDSAAGGTGTVRFNLQNAVATSTGIGFEELNKTAAAQIMKMADDGAGLQGMGGVIEVLVYPASGSEVRSLIEQRFTKKYGIQWTNIVYTDDFESYAIGAFPAVTGAVWDTLSEDTNFSADIVASDPAFPTQNLRTVGNASIIGYSRYAYTAAGEFIDGQVDVEFAYSGGGVSTSGGIIMQYVDGNNFLEFRTYLSQGFLIEHIAGVENQRAYNGGLSALTQGFPYKLSLTVSGTTAHVVVSRAFGDFADLWNESGIAIAGGVSGKVGVQRYSVFYVNDVNFDNFNVIPA